MDIKVGLRDIAQYNETLEPRVLECEKEENALGQIVFYGPSYFTRWRNTTYAEKTMTEALPGKSGKQCVINRGFGSSCAEHQLYYYPRMVRPLAPKVLVYESYENGGSFGYTPEESFWLAKRVVTYARTDFPGIHIYLCGPHPNREAAPESMQKREQYAALLQKLVQETPDCFYIDVLHHPLMQGKDIYIDDGVHFNAIGYQMYTKLFQEALKEELERY